jgi:tRNA pseudouridine38-40 synthase
MRNLLVLISFNGSRYHGWQVQSNAVSVQTVFQTALEKILCEKTEIKGCSRTDTGVHANEYAISFLTSRDIPCTNLVFALNRFLPSDIAAISCCEVPMDFHARYSCKGKEYVYKVWNAPVRNAFLDGLALHYRYHMDIEKMNEAALLYIGRHDFTSFCTLDSRERKNMVREVRTAKVEKNGNTVTFTVSADGFLYNMVRIMMGTLLFVSQGKIKPSEIPKIIDGKNRSLSGPTAPACGLYLNRVFY